MKGFYFRRLRVTRNVGGGLGVGRHEVLNETGLTRQYCVCTTTYASSTYSIHLRML